MVRVEQSVSRTLVQDEMTMGELVRTSIAEGVAVIEVNNPPVNALGDGVPKGIRAAIEIEFHLEFGERWKPAPLLRRLAEEGKTFREYDAERNT